LILQWDPTEWGEKTGQITSALGPFIDKRCIERGAHIYRQQFSTRGDTSVRAQGIRGLIAMRGRKAVASSKTEPERQSCVCFRPYLTEGYVVVPNDTDTIGLVVCSLRLRALFSPPLAAKVTSKGIMAQ
jgi:hypothetical protein